MFWQSTSDVFRDEKILPYPVANSGDVSNIAWVIDGMQRVSTLYGVFHWESTWDSDLAHFNVYFDLDNLEFFINNDRHGKNIERCMSLSGLFTSRKILGDHQRFLNFPDADTLIENSINLQAVFQEYLIPTVTLHNSSLEEVVIIFERVNNTGVKLNVSQFMRAITWSENFDLDEAIDSVLDANGLVGFGINKETFTKAISLFQDKGISPEVVAKLRELDKESLNQYISQTGKIFSKLIDFLIKEFNIYNLKFLPYEGQALFLFKLMAKNQSSQVEDAAKVWVWRTSFSETLRGKPDDHIQKHLDRLDRALSGQITEIDEQFTLIPEKFQERKFKFDAALTMVTSAMFANHESRDLFTGEIIDPALYMEGHNSLWFESIVPHNDIRTVGMRRVSSNRILANLVLITPDSLREIRRSGSNLLSYIKVMYDYPNYSHIFNSQFIDRDCVLYLENGMYEEFIIQRSKNMANYAAELSRIDYRW